MKWWRVHLSLCSIETLGLVIYNLVTGSQPGERFLFNLSLIRFLTVIGLSLILIGFLLLVWLSVKNQTIKNFLTRKCSDPRLFLIIILASTLLLFSDLYLVSLNSKDLGIFHQLYTNSEPFQVWIYLISLQTWLFALVWFCYLFIGNLKEKDSSKNNNELLILLGIFIVSILFKVFFVLPSAYGPVIRGDEMRYFQMARYWNDGNFFIQNIYHSPFFYPQMLSIAFLFKEYAYTAIKILNTLFSSSIIFPIFLIARNFFSKKEALLISILVSLLPFHFVFPRMILSENLYFPLFLWTILLISFSPRDPKGYPLWNILTGIAIGALYLTRYITLPVIPAFLLSWWLKQPYGKEDLLKPDRRKILNLLLLVGSMVITFSPWLVMGMRAGASYKELLGFGITAETTVQQLTFKNLLVWASLYLSYILLMISPVLPVIMAGIASSKFRDWPLELKNWFGSIAVILMCFLAAAVRHSWRAFYNADDASRIMGRYILFFTPLFIISAFLLIKNTTIKKDASLPRHLLFTVIIPAGLIYLAYAHLLGNAFHLHDGNLISILGSLDAAYVMFLGPFFLLILAWIYLSSSYVLWQRKYSLLKTLIFFSLAVFYLVGTPVYVKELISCQNYQFLGQTIVNTLKPELQASQDVIEVIIYTPSGAADRDRTLLSNTIEFNNVDNLLVSSIENFSPSKFFSSDRSVQKIVIYEVDDLPPSLYKQENLVDFAGSQYIILR